MADVHALAAGMSHVNVVHGGAGNPVYQVGGTSFVSFRTPRPDAKDPETGERYPDVIDGHPSVLLRASRIGELSRQELTEIVQDAGTSRAAAEEMAHEIARFPQDCVWADLRSVHGQYGKPLRQALREEFENGIDAMAGERVAGAGRFVGGHGRHGDYAHSTAGRRRSS